MTSNPNSGTRLTTRCPPTGDAAAAVLEPGGAPRHATGRLPRPHRHARPISRHRRKHSYGVSQRIRKRNEEDFDWIKRVAGQERTKFHGRARVGWAFTFAAAADNLARLPKFLETPA